MAETFLRDYPALNRFVLSDVQPTGVTIGSGAYGSVEEVTVPVGGAAKTIHGALQQEKTTEPSKIAADFVRECELMSTIRHPNVVQFFGVAFFRDSALPSLVMERMLVNLDELLTSEALPDALLSTAIKCSILRDVACGLAYLHERSPPIIHRDLSAKNILLNAEMVAKIADLGVARIAPRARAAATMTKGPGTLVYMPPEAFAPTAKAEKSKYDASIDAFSFGIVTIFTISGRFPCDILEPTYFDRKVGALAARTELERRSEYVRDVKERLVGGRENHPLIRLIEQCLRNDPLERPSARVLLHLLEEAKGCIGDDTESEFKKRQLVQGQSNSTYNLERILQGLVTENADLESKIQELHPKNQSFEREVVQALAEAQQQLREKEEKLQSGEKKQERVKQYFETELTKAEEGVSKKQQEIDELKQQKNELLQTKERELAEAKQKLKQKEERLKFSEALVTDLKLQLAKYFASYTCQVSGPGLLSATVNHPTHILVEVFDASGKPYSTQLSITAELEHLPNAKFATTPATGAKRLKFKQLPIGKPLLVTTISPFQYKVLYTAVNQGQQKLHIKANDREIKGSPFTFTAYSDPTQIGYPVTFVTNLSGPYGIAFNSHDQMIVSECSAHKLSIFDNQGKLLTTFGSHGKRPDEMIAPAGIAVDNTDHIYVTSEHKLQKFASSGELLKCIGQKGNKEGEFDDPRGVRVYKSHIYVCDRNNHRIQVFDLNMTFVRSIGSHGKRRGELNAPLAIQFDSIGNTYISELGNKRVQVFDNRGKSVQIFGHEGEGKLRSPSGLHVAEKFVYVSDSRSHCIVVYETSGRFVTSHGSYGQGDGAFDSPYGITSCINGYIHVCDCDNDRVQIF